MNELVNASKIADIKTWFSNCREKLGVRIQRISAEKCADWKLHYTESNELRSIGHVTGRFHQISFLKSWEPLCNAWIDRCILEPLAEGENNIYGVALLAEYNNKFLVQAKGEPGYNTPDRVALSCTIQASYANMAMMLSGKIEFLELLSHPGCKKYNAPQDGGHLLNKTNQICYVKLTEPPNYIPPSFYWATMDELKLFAAEGLVSEFLFQTLAMRNF